MNLRQIEVFRAIMMTGSISDASRLLHVSAPAVSRLLSYTESGLGFPLFERVKGRLHPTAEARRLLHEVEVVHRGVQRVERLTRELGQRRHGVLNVVASPSIGQMLVPAAIARFRRDQPTVRINFQALNNQHLKERLLNRQTEIGVSILPVDHPHLHTAPIARSRIVCICPPDHLVAQLATIHLHEMRPFPLVSYPPDTPFGARIEQMFLEADEPLNVAVEVGSPQNACALVQAGFGLALVDEFSLEAWPGADFVIRPVDKAPEIVADLVHARAEPLSPAAEAFVSALREVLAHRGFGLVAES